MPNNCENTLTILGPNNDIDRFIKTARSVAPRYSDSESGRPKDTTEEVIDILTQDQDIRDLNFNAFVPVPIDILEKGYSQSGHDWQVENWGTKWNAYETQVFRISKSVVYSFETAWSPPEPVVKAMAKMFPTLRFRLKYWECGAGYEGTLICKGEKVIKDETNEQYRGRRGG